MLGTVLLDMWFITGRTLDTNSLLYLYCLLCARPLLRYFSFANGCNQGQMFSGLKSSISHACHRSWELILAPVCRYLNGVRKFKQVFQSHMTSKLMEPKAESQAYVSPPSNPSSSTLKSESVVKSSHPSCLTLLKHFDIIFIKNYKKNK